MTYTQPRIVAVHQAAKAVLETGPVDKSAQDRQDGGMGSSSDGAYELDE